MRLTWEGMLGHLGPFSLERRRRNDKSVSSLCITEEQDGEDGSRLFSEVPSKRTSDNNLKLKWKMGAATYEHFLIVLEQDEGSFGKLSIRDTQNLPRQD